jgi:hypothetical protein
MHHHWNHRRQEASVLRPTISAEPISEAGSHPHLQANLPRSLESLGSLGSLGKQASYQVLLLLLLAALL